MQNDGDRGYFAPFPDREGDWGIEVNGEEVEVYAETLPDDTLGVCGDELEDIFDLTSDSLVWSEEDDDYVLASSLGQEDGADVWKFKPRTD